MATKITKTTKITETFVISVILANFVIGRGLFRCPFHRYRGDVLPCRMAISSPGCDRDFGGTDGPDVEADRGVDPGEALARMPSVRGFEDACDLGGLPIRPVAQVARGQRADGLEAGYGRA